MTPTPDTAGLRVGSLFSGIGGLDLGLERAGMRVVWQSEVDPFCCDVLAKHWPDVPNLGDVTKIEWEDVERVDLICGGYPCQPFSTAGDRRGAADPRHLWPEFARALRVLRPHFALLENVPGHLSLGFDEVLRDLAALGFDAEWSVVPAAAVGAAHRRPRLFVLAHADGVERFARRWLSTLEASGGHGHELADAHRCCTHGARSGDAVGGLPRPELVRATDGIPDRVDRTHALGNAVVPQVAEWIGRRIVDVERRAA